MIKYDYQNKPAFCRRDTLIGSTQADFITLTDGGEDRLEPGDYVSQDQDGNPTAIIRAANAQAQADRIALELGQELKRTIRSTIKGMNLTAAEKVDLMDRILAIWVLLDDGDLQGARFKANNTATGGSYTAGRRNGLVALIDQAITQLP